MYIYDYQKFSDAEIAAIHREAFAFYLEHGHLHGFRRFAKDKLWPYRNNGERTDNKERAAFLAATKKDLQFHNNQMEPMDELLGRLVLEAASSGLPISEGTPSAYLNEHFGIHYASRFLHDCRDAIGTRLRNKVSEAVFNLTHEQSVSHHLKPDLRDLTLLFNKIGAVMRPNPQPEVDMYTAMGFTESNKQSEIVRTLYKSEHLTPAVLSEAKFLFDISKDTLVREFNHLYEGEKAWVISRVNPQEGWYDKLMSGRLFWPALRVAQKTPKGSNVPKLVATAAHI